LASRPHATIATMPRNLFFVAPFPTDPTMRFVRAVKKLDDVRLFGVVHTPPTGDDAKLYEDMVRVTDPMNVQDIFEGVEVLRRRHGEPFRILGILEAMMVQLAQVRERYGVSGTPAKTAELFRDKAMMKDALRAAGIPVARHKLITSEADARAFAEEVGFPMVVKPPAGMAAKSTFRVSSLKELLSSTSRASERSPVLAEEMLRGKEHSFETITVGGVPRVSSFAQYFPGPLEVLETPWIQWACILPREIDTPLYAKAREIGTATIKALGLQDGMTHMEWYEKEDGSIAVGEIAQRPPGGQLCQMTGLVNDIDIYRAWARAVVDGELDAPWERKFAAGTAFIRGTGRGRVLAVRGLRQTHDAIAPWLVEAKLPSVGTPKGEGYEGDGYIVVRAETTQKVHELIKTIIETIEIHYTG
jgi:biotin carboxylase